MNELESVDIFCMSEHPKRVSSHEVTASRIHDTYMYHLIAKGLSRKSEARNSDFKSEIMHPKSVENVCFSLILLSENLGIANFKPALFGLKNL